MLLATRLDDWLQAEREVLWSAPVELIKTATEFWVRIPVAGFDAKQIQVMAVPDAIIVQTEADHKVQEYGVVRLNEFTNKRLFRRLDLPTPVNDLPTAVSFDKVTATLEQGMLQLVSAKVSGDQTVH